MTVQQKFAAVLQKKYHSDLQKDFVNEIDGFTEFIRTKEKKCALGFLQLIKKMDLSSVSPNMDIAIRIYLTLLVTNAAGEHYLLKLGLVKNRLPQWDKRDLTT